MRKSVEEWLERGEHDLEAAQLLLDREAHFDVVQNYFERVSSVRNSESRDFDFED